ncbi:hypothetical protein AB0O58_22170 [Rhodococcus sp. NPDC080181]|jgi:hypothetical protein|uniref:hypothetical protein n=1 Tax=Rhodococcus sp. NPDC080181 TaxID=3155292 RepID=UPI003450C173
MTAPIGSPSPIPRQAPEPTPAAQPGLKKRQPRGIEKARAEAEPAREPALAEEEPIDGVDLADQVFADVIPGPPAPNTQPATDESKAAVAREATARRQAVTKGLRDEAVRNRLFSGENAKRSPKEKAGLLSERHDQYTQLMALNCIKPMAQGIDASTLTEAVSTAAVMWALSPRFRELMADYNTKINDALRVTRSKNLDNNTRVPLGSSRETVEAAQTTAQREDKAMLDQVAAVLKGAESVPFSTEAAAMSLLQIHEDAYVAMREGEDPDAVTASLKETVDELNDIWKSQKLDPQLVTATARTLAGRTDGVEDLRLAQFVETAGGSVRPSQQSVVTGSGGAAVASWGGQWSMAAGKLLDSARSRMFEVRRVADARSHQDSLSTLVFQDLALASKAGPAELRKAVIGHLASWELRDYNLDPSGIGGASRDRSVACAQRSRVAYAAMADDGIDEGIRQTVASNALMNGMKAFETAEPEAVALMSKQFGDSHSEAVAELVARGRERGKHVPVRPLIFEPVNREHAAKMVGQPAAPSEQARELGTEAPRPSALAPWGPRAHPDVLAAERTNRQGGEALAPRRVVNVARPQSVRRGVDRREPLDRTSVATPGRSAGTERQDQAPTRSESPRTPIPEHPRQGRTSEPIRAEHTVGRHARRDEASAGAPAPAWTPPTSSAPRSPWEPGPDVAGVGKGLRPQPEKRATPPALGGNAAKATNREVGPEPTT